jgi:hypothetical protein
MPNRKSGTTAQLGDEEGRRSSLEHCSSNLRQCQCMATPTASRHRRQWMLSHKGQCTPRSEMVELRFHLTRIAHGTIRLLRIDAQPFQQTRVTAGWKEHVQCNVRCGGVMRIHIGWRYSCLTVPDFRYGQRDE